MLTGIQEIQQDTLIKVTDFVIDSGFNMMIFGRAGLGKTEIPIQRSDIKGRRAVYLNLSVIEAPDLVGLPKFMSVKSKDGTRSFDKTTYCPPEKFRLLGESEGDDDGDVLIVDEIDKARPELQNPCLELFQYRSINGVKMNIKAVIATANLPDENAFSQTISHALTNRCIVFKLGNAAYDPWAAWAVANGVNGLIVGFLSRNAGLLETEAPKDDATGYLRGSPRSWTNAARALDSAKDADLDFQTLLVAGFVGLSNAAQFRVWLDHYRHIQPAIDNLVKNGKHPTDKDIDGHERLFVFGIAGANAILLESQRVDSGKSDQKKLHKVVENVMGWIETIPSEYAVGAVKSVLTMDVINKHNLMKIDIFMKCFVKIRAAWDSK